MDTYNNDMLMADVAYSIQVSFILENLKHNKNTLIDATKLAFETVQDQESKNKYAQLLAWLMKL